MPDYDLWRKFCKQSFDSSSEYRSHANSSPGIFYCDHPECHQILSWTLELPREEVLKNHYLRSHFRCPLPGCGETLFGHDMLTEVEALRLHYGLAHPSTYCFECDAIFENEVDLRTHTNGPHLRCSPCGKNFRSKSDQDAHNESVHARVKHCQTCGGRNDDGKECACSPSEKFHSKRSRSRQKSKGKMPYSQSTPESTNTSGGSHYKDNDEQDERFRKHCPKPKPQASTKPTIAKPTDYYTLLGLSSNASDSEIAKAAKKARITYHPDRYIGKNISPEEMTKIGEVSKAVGQAADVLSNPKEKAKYDAKLRTERSSSKHASSSTAAPNPSKPKPSNPTQRPKASRENHYSRYERDSREWPGTPPRAPKEQSSSKSGSDPFTSGRSAFSGGSPYNPQDRPPGQNFNNRTDSSAPQWQSGNSQSSFQTGQGSGNPDKQWQPGSTHYSYRPFPTSTHPFAASSQWSTGASHNQYQPVPCSSTNSFGNASPTPAFQSSPRHEGLAPGQARQKAHQETTQWSNNLYQQFTGIWGQSPITGAWNQDAKATGVDDDGDVRMADA